MPTRTRTAVAAVLVATAAAPAAASAAEHLDLRGAATLRQTADDTAVLRFAVDAPIAGARKGTAQLGSLDRATIRADGRHGDDFRYRATFRAGDLEAGVRYAVRIAADGRRAQTLRVKLIDQR